MRRRVTRIRQTTTSTNRKKFRSGLEATLDRQLEANDAGALYESVRISFTQPPKVRSYLTDFILPNGIIIEAKGRFTTADRQKHKWIKEQHPDLDIRFVFSNSKNRISKKSKTTYARWCLDHGFLFADKTVPTEWIREKPCPRRLAAIEAAQKKARGK